MPGARRVRFLITAARMAWDALRDGRLSPSPKHWLIHLRNLHGVLHGGPGAAGARPAVAAAPGREALTARRRAELTAFLASGDRLRFAATGAPVVSVLLVLYNRAELTLSCLKALLDQTGTPFEVVIVDNRSTDATAALLDRIEGASVIRRPENAGYLRACNLAARAACGEFLLFLNNDADLLPDSLRQAVATARRSPAIGAVGGRLIQPDGRLQEAGSVIWRDGSCQGYGRDESPEAPECLYVRDVDYCSAALLLTPRALFLDLGAFDDRFAPAYYEDADYCVRLWQAGKRVVYQPRVAAMHVEFASSPDAASAIEEQGRRRAVFVEKHRDWLEQQPDRRTTPMLLARDRRPSGRRILVVDDRVPRYETGFGFPRAVELVRALVDLGHFVTLYPTVAVNERWPDAGADLPETVEVVLGWDARRLGAFLAARPGYYDRLLVSRAHNMSRLRAKLGAPDAWAAAGVIYDAETVAAFLDAGRARTEGRPFSDDELARRLAAEAGEARGAQAVVCVTATDARVFDDHGVPNVHVIGHAIEASPGTAPFHARGGLLFVGAFHELSPNADSVLWFAREVLPLLRRSAVHREVTFTVAGQNPPPDVRALAARGITIRPSIADLGPVYDAARVFVAPTRYAAGLPLKVVHAAAHGLPVVATSLLARQLGWRHGTELLVADSPGDCRAACDVLLSDERQWCQIREGALARVRAAFSREGLRVALAKVIESGVL